MKLDHSTTEPPQKDEIKKSPKQASDNKTFEVIDTKPSPHTNNDPSDPPTNNANTTKETLENCEIKKKADQTSDKNTFQVLDTKPLTNANNDASGSKQEDNDDAIPSMSSASNVEDAEPNDDNWFHQDLINHR
ncbi:uncharacterized protein LOC126704058 [Quercus robur]|uniref:uncharacterized protein LOC126704058 n=1 Tax=Quercus robur TaxID=38942 RepID=UPI0021624ADC|nr:uncharacterized protein LOC126704058 [Quercus robur]